MARLSFLLGDRQSAYIANVRDGSNVRKLFFSAEPKEDTKIDGKLCQHGCTVEVVEGNATNQIGQLSYSDALDSNGKPSQVQVGLEVQVPKNVFEELSTLDLDRSVLWLSCEATDLLPERLEGLTGGSGNLASIRFSFLSKQQAPQQDDGKDIARRLDRIFWAMIVIGAGILWRLHL